jgi:N6-adenosine-specific RNA methylase IME4
MNKLPVKRPEQLPDTIEQLRDFILIGQERLKVYQAKIRAIEKVGLAKNVRDQALHEAQDVATAVLYAEVKLGELLKGIEPKRDKQSSTQRTSLPSLPDGITKKQSHYAQELADNKNVIEEVIEIAIKKEDIPTSMKVFRKIKETKRQEKREKNKELITTNPKVFPEQKFSTIVLDPPWDWGDEGDQDQLGRAKPTYSTMSLDKLMEFPISDLTEKNAHIYLWITNRSLPKGFALLEKWGFRYITLITWGKPSFGMGNYFRGQTEHIIFGVKGLLSLLRNDVGTLLLAKKGKRHSEKPDEFYSLVESCSPGPWLDMFARKQRPGWIVWGAEVA